MLDVRLSESEYRLMDVVWEKEPISGDGARRDLSGKIKR